MMKTVTLQPPSPKLPTISGPNGGPPVCPKSPATQKKEHSRKKWLQIRDSLKLARIKIALSETKFFSDKGRSLCTK
ncbi:hypothetical protein QR680_000301 [Steinernema hermaphroditum]|uniref:Uncharacterized protein n=1 Tax=Steinernema hermaphroditum TaxID=289476 RepID=A0AA39GU39_9BILA|nr:hypothetical protein QR680_000301 [Steinernema hermaphroditum]